VSDTKTTGWIAALERARAELERDLSADERWRGQGEGGAPPGHRERDRALAESPVYRCWEQLNAAIEELRAVQAGPAPARHRVSLREVLERIRADAGLAEAEPQASVSDGVRQTKPARMEPAGTAPSAPSTESGLGRPPAKSAAIMPPEMEPEMEEATVSFVIREPVRAAPAASQIGEAASIPEEPPAEEPDPGAEAEVTIVRRR
jgi:hypothetical protein